MDGLSAQRTTGLVLGGAAAVALAAAVVVGLLPFGNSCAGPARALCQADAEETQAWLLAGLLVATVLLAVAAVVSMLLAPRRAEAGPGWAELSGAPRTQDAAPASEEVQDEPRPAEPEQPLLPGQAPTSGLRQRSAVRERRRD